MGLDSTLLLGASSRSLQTRASREETGSLVLVLVLERYCGP